MKKLKNLKMFLVAVGLMGSLSFVNCFAMEKDVKEERKVEEDEIKTDKEDLTKEELIKQISSLREENLGLEEMYNAQAKYCSERLREYGIIHEQMKNLERSLGYNNRELTKIKDEVQELANRIPYREAYNQILSNQVEERIANERTFSDDF